MSEPAENPAGPAVHLRQPRAEDGPAVTALIAACPPLDRNSAYCNLLQCTDFAATSIVAEHKSEPGGKLVGWVSGYCPPASPQDYFVWQVAVAESARGQGLAARMIIAVLNRSALAGVTHLISTVTTDNQASWSLFNGLARHWGVPLEKTLRFDRNTHFAGAAATEWQARIGPLPQRSPNQGET